MNSELEQAAEYLREAKAGDLVLLDFHGAGPVADQVLIASAKAVTHLRSLADGLRHLMPTARLEGGSDWIVIDAGNLMIHLFLEDQREFYALEDLWDSADRIPV